MSSPFILEPKPKPKPEEIMLGEVSTNIYIVRNLLSTKEAGKLRDLIETSPKGREDYAYGANVSASTLHLSDVNDKEQYNIVKKCLCEISKHMIPESCHETDGWGENFSPPDIHVMLRKIDGATKSHADGVINTPKVVSTTNNVRIFSVIIALNSDYEGGELCFPKQDISIKLKVGEAVIFPPYWTHPHHTNALNGTFRYTINTWLCK